MFRLLTALGALALHTAHGQATTSRVRQRVRPQDATPVLADQLQAAADTSNAQVITIGPAPQQVPVNVAAAVDLPTGPPAARSDTPAPRGRPSLATPLDPAPNSTLPSSHVNGSFYGCWRSVSAQVNAHWCKCTGCAHYAANPDDCPYVARGICRYDDNKCPNDETLFTCAAGAQPVLDLSCVALYRVIKSPTRCVLTNDAQYAEGASRCSADRTSMEVCTGGEWQAVFPVSPLLVCATIQYDGRGTSGCPFFSTSLFAVPEALELENINEVFARRRKFWVEL